MKDAAERVGVRCELSARAGQEFRARGRLPSSDDKPVAEDHGELGLTSQQRMKAGFYKGRIIARLICPDNPDAAVDGRTISARVCTGQPAGTLNRP